MEFVELAAERRLSAAERDFACFKSAIEGRLHVRDTGSPDYNRNFYRQITRGSTYSSYGRLDSRLGFGTESTPDGFYGGRTPVKKPYSRLGFYSEPIKIGGRTPEKKPYSRIGLCSSPIKIGGKMLQKNSDQKPKGIQLNQIDVKLLPLKKRIRMPEKNSDQNPKRIQASQINKKLLPLRKRTRFFASVANAAKSTIAKLDLATMLKSRCMLLLPEPTLSGVEEGMIIEEGNRILEEIVVLKIESFRNRMHQFDQENS